MRKGKVTRIFIEVQRKFNLYFHLNVFISFPLNVCFVFPLMCVKIWKKKIARFTQRFIPFLFKCALYFQKCLVFLSKCTFYFHLNVFSYFHLMCVKRWKEEVCETHSALVFHFHRRKKIISIECIMYFFPCVVFYFHLNVLCISL